MFKIFSTYVCWKIYKMQRLEYSGAVWLIYGSLGVKGLIHQQFIDMQNLLPSKRIFTQASTLTYTSATTHMKTNNFKKRKVRFIPTMVTRQKKSHLLHTTNTKTYTNATSYIFTKPDGLCGNQCYRRELLIMGIMWPEICWALRKHNKVINGI